MAPPSFEDLVAKHFQALPTGAEARRAAELKKYQAFVEAVNDPFHGCFCQWVDKRTARNWQGPQFWSSLHYCATHKKMGFREKPKMTAEVRPSKADLKVEYTKFVEAVNDPKQLCFCRWVDSFSAKNWKGPKFWNELRYCYVHKKMGLNDARRKQDEVCPREAALVRYNTFRAAIDNFEHPCFCQWVDVPEARNWRSPKFWDQLQHCKTHDKNGVRRGTLGQNGRRRKRHTVIIDLVDSSDEERSEGAERTITEQARIPENTDRRRGREINAETTASEFSRRSEIPKAIYTRHTIATDILRSAGIHPTLPPLNWWTDPNLLDIKAGHQAHREVLKNYRHG